MAYNQTLRREGGGKEEEEGGVDVTFAVTNVFRIVYGC